jgi:hypothetical protein
LGSLYLLKGRIWECLDNRVLASTAFRDALLADVYCTEAFQALTQHHILSAAEEKELLRQMQFQVRNILADGRYQVCQVFNVAEPRGPFFIPLTRLQKPVYSIRNLYAAVTQK